jgi:hypothetical protein
VAWYWTYEAGSGAQLTSATPAANAPAAPPEGFPTQSDAETWIGEVWRNLQEAGVDAVILYDGERQVYGPMSLHAS